MINIGLKQQRKKEKQHTKLHLDGWLCDDVYARLRMGWRFRGYIQAPISEKTIVGKV